MERASGEQVRPWTAEEQRPFTDRPTARRAVSNIFCVALVAREESALGFLGWVACWKRPLQLSTSEGTEGCLLHGGTATVFDSYAEAVNACENTLALAEAGGYSWFEQEGGIRIFSVGRFIALP